MIRRVVCSMFALLLVFAFVNTASADEAAAAPAAEAVVVNDCDGCAPTCCDPCCAPVVYRRGFFGCYRPAYVAPCCYPVYPRYYGCGYGYGWYRGWGWRGGCCW